MMTRISPLELRRVFGKFATGVTVVTYRADGVPRGATVNSFTSVSLDPPLALVSLSRRAKACENLHGRQFAINILTVDQRNLALHFAGVPQPSVRNPFIEADAGDEPPVLQGCLAYIVCDPWAVHDAGDHKLFIGEVVGLSEVQPDAEQRPLGFFGGQFCRVESGERIWAANNELIAAMQQSLSFSW
ncbi:flavin reductase family protein [Sphaerimonospora mesophila]|uniref:flavin reductase family protein n=1 Tax=Sphaerimonospora mesophila TaxID=37483 RepID=UPI0007C6AF1E